MVAARCRIHSESAVALEFFPSVSSPAASSSLESGCLRRASVESFGPGWSPVSAESGGRRTLWEPSPADLAWVKAATCDGSLLARGRAYDEQRGAYLLLPRPKAAGS